MRCGPSPPGPTLGLRPHSALVTLAPAKAAVATVRRVIHQRIAVALSLVLILVISVLGGWHSPMAMGLMYQAPKDPPGPMALRERTTKLRDPYTGLPRIPPAEADAALDYFQRTNPEVTTEEHHLIKRWEDLVNVFGGVEAATELVYKEPKILRSPRPLPRRTFHFLCMHLGPKMARDVVNESPYILTRKPGQVRKTLPALLNIYGTKERLAEILTKYPTLVHVPTGDFYKGFGSMIAVGGNPKKALEVGKEAMARLKTPPHKSCLVPECWPALVAVVGGVDEAYKCVEREPYVLRMLGEQFLGRLARLRSFLGREGAQKAVQRAPYFLLHEDQRKSHKFTLAYTALERVFGTEEATRRAIDAPELLALGHLLARALGFAERKLGSVEAVRDNFDDVLRRTGLLERIVWETKPRPRHGVWTPAKGRRPGLFLDSWSPPANPTGAGGPARGRWDEDPPDVTDVVDLTIASDSERADAR